MPGPLPAAQKRRRNAPTIPTTNLPAGGRKNAPPKMPPWVHLGKAGRAWWRWAWRTPQAAAWPDGVADVVARRARLEDDIEAIAYIGLDLDMLPAETPLELAAYLEHVKYVIEKLKSLASGKLAIEREMRELDDRLGLTPKAMAALRWTIVADAEPEAAGSPTPERDELEERRRRLASDAS